VNTTSSKIRVKTKDKADKRTSLNIAKSLVVFFFFFFFFLLSSGELTYFIFLLFFAACECNNHSESCIYNATKGYGVCKDNALGDKGDSCKESFYRNAAVPQHDSHSYLGKIIIWTKRTFVELQSTQSAILSLYIECNEVRTLKTMALLQLVNIYRITL